jgi:hypothetical protein
MDPKRVESYNQIKMCMCVDIYDGYMVANLILLCSLLMVVTIHYKPLTLFIEMVTNRNLGVLTDNFHKFW